MRKTCILGDRRHALAPPRAWRWSRRAITRVVATALLLGGASPAIAQAPVNAGPAALPSPASAHPYAAPVAEASRRFGIPEAWIWSVMRVESAGNPSATSHAGAMGLMQIMPGTYTELRARYGFGPDAYDPRDNILAGTAYLREMYDRYGSAGFLAAYNAGPGRWEDYARRGRPLPAETVAYMARLGVIGGGDAAIAARASAPVDRLAWTRSTLFVGVSTATAVQIGNGPAAPPPTANRTPIADGTPVALAEENAPAEAAPTVTDPLFAIRRPR